MTTVFISYSEQDAPLAKKLYYMTSTAGIDAFLASISIKPVSNWTETIFKHLNKAKWVFFLATKTQ